MARLTRPYTRRRNRLQLGTPKAQPWGIFDPVRGGAQGGGGGGDSGGLGDIVGDVVNAVTGAAGDVVDAASDAVNTASSAASTAATSSYTAAGGRPPRRRTPPPASATSLVSLLSPLASLTPLGTTGSRLLSPALSALVAPPATPKPPSPGLLEDLDKRTLGDPSIEELVKAAGEGFYDPNSPTRLAFNNGEVSSAVGGLGVNKAGLLTTPRIRSASRRLNRAQRLAARARGPLPGLDAEQSAVARQVLSEGREAGATPRELLAAIETGLVESNFRNLDYGDADSEGWRQERTSIYGTGPTGPRNVRASAERFFDEIRTDPGTSTAATPGLLAQATQSSEFPELYDAQESVARPILSAYRRGTADPMAARRLRRAKANAKALGIPTNRLRASDGNVGRGGRIPGAVWFGKVAESPRFGLEVRENPFFDPVDPVHTEGSHHYQEYAPNRGEAIDVVGNSEDLARYNRWAARRFGEGLTELYYDPGVNISDGTETGPIGGHGTHVHLAVDSPGSEFGGGLAVGGGGIAPAVPGVGGAIPAAATIGGAAPAGGQGGLGRRRAAPSLVPLVSPFGSGPVLPSDLFAPEGQPEVEGAQENLLALLGEDPLNVGFSGRRPVF